jgi:NAD(P)-dependent dehydrogenase (short-subunit alcohol dehydrogenase family)
MKSLKTPLLKISKVVFDVSETVTLHKRVSKTVMDLCFDVEDQTAVVTGASSGLGVLFAETLAEVGINLVIAARRYEKLVKVAEDLSSKYNVKVVPVKTDVSQEEQVIKMVKTAVENLGSLEILVNNAGIASLSPSVDMSLEEWKKVIDINLTGVFLCARTAAREMIEKKYGKIVNIASIYGAVGDIFPTAPYYASKGAVINLTRALAVEWAPYKINVNAIAPGFFPSEMTTSVFEDEKALKYILSRTPLGRTGDPLDLKAALIYLASPASNYITGQTLFVDGGWTAL